MKSSALSNSHPLWPYSLRVSLKRDCKTHFTARYPTRFLAFPSFPIRPGGVTHPLLLVVVWPCCREGSTFPFPVFYTFTSPSGKEGYTPLRNESNEILPCLFFQPV